MPTDQAASNSWGVGLGAKWSLIHQLSDCGFPGAPWGLKLAPPLFSPPLFSTVFRLSIGERAPYILIEKGGYLTSPPGIKAPLGSIPKVLQAPPLPPIHLLLPSISLQVPTERGLASSWPG